MNMNIFAIIFIVIVLGIYLWQREAGKKKPVSVVLLPLQSLTNDVEQEWFTDGMTDALITDLAKNSGLRVISRSSAMQYKRTNKTPPEIASELGARYLIEGSIVKTGEQVKVSARLINAPKDEYLWAEEYEREFGNILGLQGEIAQTIAGQIRVKLTPQEEMRLASTRTVKPETYEMYLKGMYHLNKYTPDAMIKGMEYLHEAVNEDPEEPFTYAVLALGYNTIIHTGAVKKSVKITRIKNKEGKDIDCLRGGDRDVNVYFKFLQDAQFIREKDRFIFREGNTRGSGHIVKIIE